MTGQNIEQYVASLLLHKSLKFEVAQDLAQYLYCFLTCTAVAS